MVGFLAGISVHILVSQMPGVLGLPAPSGPMLDRIATLARHLGEANIYTVCIGFGVLAIVAGAEAISAKIPGALIGLVAATSAVIWAGLESKGVAVVGTVPASLPTPSFPVISVPSNGHACAPGFLIAIVVMVQTAATTRSFPSDPDKPADVDRDFLGAGAGSVLAGLFGAFPVDASPPRTGIVSETGGRTQLSGLFAAAIVLALLAFGATLLQHVPECGARRRPVVRGAADHPLRQIVTIFRQSIGEFLLVVATAAAIIVLPIEQGVAVGIALLAAARHLEHDPRAAGAVRARAGYHDLVAGQVRTCPASAIRISPSSACRRRCRSSTPRISAPMCSKF